MADSNSSTYVSGARSTLRLMWFLDFITQLIAGLLSDPSAQLSTAAKAAYKAALEPHHGWALKHTINAAMNFLPTRQAFFQGLAGPSPPAPQAAGAMPMTAGGGGAGAGYMTPAEIEGKLGAFLSTVEPVRQELWRYYGQLGLTQLP